MIATRSVLIQTTPGYLKCQAMAKRLKTENNRPSYAAMTLEKLYELRDTATKVIPLYTPDSPSLPEAYERLLCIEREIAHKEVEGVQLAVLDEVF